MEHLLIDLRFSFSFNFVPRLLTSTSEGDAAAKMLIWAPAGHFSVSATKYHREMSRRTVVHPPVPSLRAAKLSGSQQNHFNRLVSFYSNSKLSQREKDFGELTFGCRLSNL